MADASERGGAGFWLPAEFFDDFVADKENHEKDNKTTDFCFPTEFPYDLETQSASAAPHFEKRWVMSTSPQSTLGRGGSWSSNGSPNGVYSPPPSPLGAEFDAVGDLIHRAAGQVAKLKLSGVAQSNQSGFMVLPRNSNQIAFQNFHLQQQQQQHYLMMKQQKPGSRVWYGEPQMHQIRATGRPMGGHQEAWPVRPTPARISASAVLSGAPAAKRERTGTGVFLPRRYGFTSDSRKNNPAPACAPDRNANAHVLNKNLSNMNGFMQYQPQPHLKSKRGFLSDYDLLVAQKNAALMLQRRRNLLLDHSSSPVARDVCLPQEWAY